MLFGLIFPSPRGRLRTTWKSSMICLLSVAGAATAHAQAPTVVASIKPVHSLVAGVMGDIGTPHLLIPGAESPHTYALRPSDADALAGADAIFWIGDDLEAFLRRPIDNLGDGASAVALIDSPGMTLLEFGEDEDFPGDHAGEHEAGGHGDGEPGHRDGRDPHVWLDPANARAMVGVIASTLSAVDPDHAAIYQANAAELRTRLTGLETDTAEKLAPFRQFPYYTFHQSFRYFDHRFGLEGRGAISISPERQPGARRLQEIRSEISESESVCVFAEPQFPPKLVDMIVRGTAARAATIDPVGASLAPGADLYFALIARNAEAFAGCFRASG